MRRSERNYHRRRLEQALRQAISALRRYSKALEDLGTGSLRLAESSQNRSDVNDHPALPGEPKWRGLCDECYHPAHGDKECQWELGDTYESGMAPMARGQCGCKGRVN